MAHDSDDTPDNLVTVRDLHYAIDTRVIYKGVDIDIARGRITAIMGPSGTGKTTLLRLISGQWRAMSGSVDFDGQRIAKLSQRQLFTLRKRMGMLFQSGALLTDLSVYDNVAFPLREHTRLPDRLIKHQLVLPIKQGCPLGFLLGGDVLRYREQPVGFFITGVAIVGGGVSVAHDLHRQIDRIRHQARRIQMITV